MNSYKHLLGKRNKLLAANIQSEPVLGLYFCLCSLLKLKGSVEQLAEDPTHKKNTYCTIIAHKWIKLSLCMNTWSKLLQLKYISRHLVELGWGLGGPLRTNCFHMTWTVIVRKQSYCTSQVANRGVFVSPVQTTSGEEADERSCRTEGSYGALSCPATGSKFYIGSDHTWCSFEYIV